MHILKTVNCKKHGVGVKANGSKRLRCAQCNVENVAKRRLSMKLQAISYKGGCCQHCGYDKYHGALEFHHIDATTKDFTIFGGSVLKWDKIKIELDKCILLCANCHREEHENIRQSLSSKVEQ